MLMFKIIKYLREVKYSVLAIVLLLIVQAYCELSLPAYTADIIDIGIMQGGIENKEVAVGAADWNIQLNYLLTTGAKMLGMTLAMLLCAILVGLLASRAGALIGKNLRERIFHQVVAFSHTEIDRFSTASLITRSTNDVQQIQMVSVMLLRMVVYAPIMGIGGIIKVAGTRT